MHVEHGPAWAVALEQSGLGEAMRTSALLYPLANVLHVLAVCAVVGPIVLADLRLLGFGRRFALRPTVALLTAIAAGGLVVALATGIPLFAADAGPLAENPRDGGEARAAGGRRRQRRAVPHSLDAGTGRLGHRSADPRPGAGGSVGRRLDRRSGRRPSDRLPLTPRARGAHTIWM
jgi:hypothetical protein